MPKSKNRCRSLFTENFQEEILNLIAEELDRFFGNRDEVRLDVDEENRLPDVRSARGVDVTWKPKRSFVSN